MSYVIVWEFEVQQGREKEFERMYGPRGAWARLFAKGKGYQGTELLREEGSSRRYLTIDRWESRGAYQRFKKEYAKEYAQMDEKGAGLTAQERKTGEFEESRQ